MGRYSLRNGTLSLPSVTAKHITLEDEDNTGTYVAPYLRVKAVAKGDSNYYHIHVGTGGRVCVSTTAPIGTSGAFANVGSPLGTVA